MNNERVEIWSVDVDPSIKHLLMLMWKEGKVEPILIDLDKGRPVCPKERGLDWIDPYILRNEPLHCVSGIFASPLAV